MIIYAITNLVNGKRYIGMTAKTEAWRWWHHMKAFEKGVKTALYDAMRKHGVENFKMGVVASLVPGFTTADLSDVERVVIAQESTLSPNGYNMTAGGDGIRAGYKQVRPSPHKGRPWSAARRASHLGVKVEKAVTPMKSAKVCVRRPTKEETAAKRSATMKRLWAENRAQFIGKVSSEGLARIGAATRKRNQSEEQRAKGRAAWARDHERRAAASERMRRANIERSHAHG